MGMNPPNDAIFRACGADQVLSVTKLSIVDENTINGNFQGVVLVKFAE